MSSAADEQFITDESSLADLASSSSGRPSHARANLTNHADLAGGLSADGPSNYGRESSPVAMEEASRRSPRSTPRRRAQRNITHAVIDGNGSLNLANLPQFPFSTRVPDSQESAFSFGPAAVSFFT